MARRIPNPNHPHTRLNMFLQLMRKKYQRYTTEEVRQAAIQSWNARALEFLEMPRTQLLQALEECAAAEFKAAWQEKYGWPFDDVYDEAKFAVHCEEERKKHLQEVAASAHPREQLMSFPADAQTDPQPSPHDPALAPA